MDKVMSMTQEEIMNAVADMIDIPLPQQEDEFTRKEFMARYGLSLWQARAKLDGLVKAGKLANRRGAGAMYYRMVKNDDQS